MPPSLLHSEQGTACTDGTSLTADTAALTLLPKGCQLLLLWWQGTGTVKDSAGPQRASAGCRAEPDLRLGSEGAGRDHRWLQESCAGHRLGVHGPSCSSWMSSPVAPHSTHTSAAQPSRWGLLLAPRAAPGALCEPGAADTTGPQPLTLPFCSSSHCPGCCSQQYTVWPKKRPLQEASPALWHADVGGSPPPAPLPKG